MPESDHNLLVKVPIAVVEQLKDEPVLLGGMGAGALIVIIAVFAPTSTQVYGWIVGGLMFLLCLGKLIFTPADQNKSSPPDGSTRVEIGDGSTFRDSRVSGDQSTFKGGNHVIVEGSVFESGSSRALPPLKDGDTGAHQ